jgi:hypothetical protein
VCGKARLEKEFPFDIDVKSRGILLASMPPIFRCPDKRTELCMKEDSPPPMFAVKWI